MLLYEFSYFNCLRPQILGHRSTNDDTNSIVDEITKPMSTLLDTRSSLKAPKDIESKESREKKKDKTSDL